MKTLELLKPVSVFGLLLVLVNMSAGQTIYYVNAAAASGGDGTSWGTAYKYLQDAVVVAGAGDQIWVARGVYRPDQSAANTSGTNERNATFQLRNCVYWYGGFAGTEDNKDQSDPEANETILSGDIGVVGAVSDNCFHVVKTTPQSGPAVCKGFTITGGNANGPNLFDMYGGGVYANGMCQLISCTITANYASAGGGGVHDMWGISVSSCTFERNEAGLFGGGMNIFQTDGTDVSHCTFVGNKAETGGGMNSYESTPSLAVCTFEENEAEAGGGISSEYGFPDVYYCTFIGNTACNYGGGMHNDKSDAILTNCRFVSLNKAGLFGGGLNNFKSNPTVTGCRFDGNEADKGGGMSNYESFARVTDCRFAGNKAESGWGGGMYNAVGSNARIIDCTFDGNVALYGGGGVAFYDFSGGSLTNCVLNENKAGSCGGGVAVRYSSSPHLANCLFTGNYTEKSNIHYGGGGFSSDFYCEPIIINCTFTDNTAAGTGGALHGSSDGMWVTNCILWGNSAVGGGAEIALWNGCPLSISYCDVQGGSGAVYSGDGTPVTWGDGMIDVDPRFKDAEGRLLWSPCINAGNSTACDVTTDLDGNPRIVNGVIDMGAYEYQQAFPDDDGDGIENSIDTLPDTYSWEFADAAGTTGSIGPHGGWGGLLITDETDPAGVRITAHPTEPTWAEVTVCGGTVLEFTMGDETVITCGSVEIEVINGPVEITFTGIDGTVATTSLEAGDSLVAEPETLTITAPSTNPDTVVIVVGEKEYTLEPGETLDITSPEISYVSASPDVLWPPNHKVVEVLISGSVVDHASGLAQVWLVIWDEYGELTSDFCDITDLLAENGDFVLPLELIAWRDGNDLDGRQYTIGVCAVDNAGNEANSEPIEVVVPHDQGKGKE